ncbi:Ig-like domain-containing protein [Pseudoalteromonas sp. GB56]
MKVQAAMPHAQQVKLQTLELTSMAKTNNGQGVMSTGQMLAVAQERQNTQYHLLGQDPSTVLRTIIPQAKRGNMPADVAATLAQKKQMTGDLELVYLDSEEEGKTRLRYFLNTGNEHIELFVPANANTDALKSGDKLSVRGWQFTQNTEQHTTTRLLLDNELSSLQVLAAGDASSDANSGVAAPLSGTTGEQKTLVLLLNFQDAPDLQPWTEQEVQDMVFGRVNDYFLEASYGQTWLSGDVRGYYTMPIDTTCDYFGMDQHARQVAQDNGVDLSQYQRLVYMLPKNDSCGWRGQGTVGGTPSRAWLNGELNLMTIGHEIGHNLGLKHAKELSCGSGYISDSCVAVTYGDKFDIMGKSEGHFNAFNKERLGWLTQSAGEVVTANDDGNFILEPLTAAASGSAKALKVRRGTDSSTGASLWYYLEYRQAQGFDSFMAGTAATNGVLVHLNQSKDDIESSQILDMTPKSSIYDLDDAALVAGNTYTDEVAGVSISTEWVSATAASVSVSYSTQTCAAANPTLNVSPVASAWVAPGTTVTYSATLSNQDSLECSASEFTVTPSVPAGWVATQATATVLPGQSASVSFEVTSPAAATDGFYDIAVTTVSASDAQYTDAMTVSYVVEAPVAQCELANPTWVLTANNTGAVEAGSVVNYQGTLTNNNSESCDPTDFAVAATLPAGFSATNQTVTLASGQSQAIDLDVVSSTSVDAGVYDFSVVANNLAQAQYQAALTATYVVAEPAPVCIAGAPTVSVQSTAGAVNPGQEQLYTVTVTNQNTDCSAATYSLSIMTPAGWFADTAHMTLADGTSDTVTLAVVSSNDATAGTYGMTLVTQDIENSNMSAYTTLSYNIVAAVNHAPIAQSDAVTISSKSAVTINVLANDSDEDGDTLTIRSVTQGSKGTVTVGTNGQLEYTPAKGFKNGDSFSYTISDGELESTTTVTITLSTADGGGTGGGGKKGKGGN